METVLTWYPAGLTMPAHAHEADQHSLILAGAVVEETGSRKTEITAGAAGFKAAGLSHGDVYGPHGALILSLNRPHRARPSAPWLWRRADAGQVRRLAALTLQGGPASSDALTDCAARLEMNEKGDPARDAAPIWLLQVREAIDADPAAARLDGLAAAAGVHRVHLSRRFAATFGTAFSLYRRRAMVAAAVRAMAENRAPASAAALEAGFCDQAHFARVLKSETGATPARLGALLRAA